MSVIKRDTWGAILENLVNSRPVEAGNRRKARYVPHLGQIFVAKESVERTRILQENQELRKIGKMPGRKWLRIPPEEYAVLSKHPEWGTHDFMQALMKEHPEYIASG